MTMKVGSFAKEPNAMSASRLIERRRALDEIMGRPTQGFDLGQERAVDADEQRVLHCVVKTG
jgi:hypothetical protein